MGEKKKLCQVITAAPGSLPPRPAQTCERGSETKKLCQVITAARRSLRSTTTGNASEPKLTMPTMLERLDLKPHEVREAGLVAAGVALGAAACLAVQGLLKMAKKPRSVKVTYFKMAGGAGPVRAALKLANIEYTNEFVDRESMKALKPKLPFGQVPVFEVNDEMVSQSNAFLRYVGKFSSLYPSDPFKALKVDEILDGVSDSMLLLRPSLIESDPAKKLRLRKELVAKPDGPCSSSSKTWRASCTRTRSRRARASSPRGPSSPSRTSPSSPFSR